MSNSGYAVIETTTIKRKTSMKERLRRWARNFLYADESTPAVVAHSSKFNGDFDGWNFRMHRANGGHIIEAWRYNHRINKHTGSSENDHELFIISSEEDIHKELPHILTQLALR